MKKDEQLVAGAVIISKRKAGLSWFLVKNDKEAEWQLPKTKVRRGESSVSAVIRMMGEMGGMRARVLEEAGRFAAKAKLNGKSIVQKNIYYLMTQKGGEEDLGFAETNWLPYPLATKKLVSTKDKKMLKSAKQVLADWQKLHPKSTLV